MLAVVGASAAASRPFRVACRSIEPLTGTLADLVAFGSLIVFSAYVSLLREAPPAILSTCDRRVPQVPGRKLTAADA